MTAASAAAPWLRATAGGLPAWRFARVVRSEPGGPQQLEWLLARNCSLTPRQLFGAYFALCAVSLTIALAFTWQGASPVLAFAGIELLLVGAALLVYSRHATDHEQILLAADSLEVVHRRGGQTEHHRFRAAWVRVEPLAGDRSLVELTGDGQSTRVGRYLRPELRQPLAQELRMALRARLAPAPRFPEPIEEPAAK